MRAQRPSQHKANNRPKHILGSARASRRRPHAAIQGRRLPRHARPPPATITTTFWARLVPPAEDPTQHSKAVAFRVTPIIADIDGLKKAVKAENDDVTVPSRLLKVYAHDATGGWVEMPEDAPLSQMTRRRPTMWLWALRDKNISDDLSPLLVHPALINIFSVVFPCISPPAFFPLHRK